MTLLSRGILRNNYRTVLGCHLAATPADVRTHCPTYTLARKNHKWLPHR
ncbi:MAG: hypothetical protein ACK5YO_05555 [Planctomyces sp.]